MLLCLLNYFSPHSFFSFYFPFPLISYFMISPFQFSLFFLILPPFPSLFPQYFLIFSISILPSFFFILCLVPTCFILFWTFSLFLVFFLPFISVLLLLSSSYMLNLSSPSPWHILILDSSNNFFQFIASLFLPFILIPHSFVTPPPTLLLCSFFFLFTLLAH